MVAVAPPTRVTPVHWMVLPTTATEPVLALTQPAPAVVRGAVQPAGTTMSISPPNVPLEAAVYVNVMVWPAAALATFERLEISVPTPFGIGWSAMMFPAYAAPVATPVVNVPETPDAAI